MNYLRDKDGNQLAQSWSYTVLLAKARTIAKDRFPLNIDGSLTIIAIPAIAPKRAKVKTPPALPLAPSNAGHYYEAFKCCTSSSS